MIGKTNSQTTKNTTLLMYIDNLRNMSVLFGLQPVFRFSPITRTTYTKDFIILATNTYFLISIFDTGLPTKGETAKTTLNQGIGIKGKKIALVWHEKASLNALQPSTLN